MREQTSSARGIASRASCGSTHLHLRCSHFDLPLFVAMAAEERPYEPPWTHRALSTFTIGGVGFLCRSFLYGLSRTETHGLDRFLEIVDSRRDETKRERGLITVSNHMSVYESIFPPLEVATC